MRKPKLQANADTGRCDAKGWMPDGVNQRPGNLATVRRRFGSWDPRYDRNSSMSCFPSDMTQNLKDVRLCRRCVRVEGKCSISTQSTAANIYSSSHTKNCQLGCIHLGKCV